MEHEFEALLVEDDAQDAELILRSMRGQGLDGRIHRVKTGADALDFVFADGVYSEREVGGGLKLVLLALRLPDVGGIEVLRRIKTDERTRKIPVVVITMSSDRSDIQGCYENGANSYVVKPPEFEGFVHAIANIGEYWLLLNEPTG